jgi:hypothetical protein
MREVQQFSSRPFLIVETGAEQGPARTTALASLFHGVARDPRMLGFVYFNQAGSANWELEGDAPALATYRTLSSSLPFGFVLPDRHRTGGPDDAAQGSGPVAQLHRPSR